MSNYAVPGETLTAIADAIRSKGDTASPLELSEMPLAISLLGGGRMRYVGEVTGRASAESQYGEIEIPLPEDGSFGVRILLPRFWDNSSFPRVITLISNAAAISGAIKGTISVCTKASVVYTGFRAGDITDANTVLFLGTSNVSSFTGAPVYEIYEII